ncbi:malonyl-CoA synthase [Chelativorans sp. AA-79]|uniref:malonate--CoA ligase n=1 Tax=Chelativorans sp. AA-79 TaxID=3028735 RepID=UPI0023F6453F|nr:malonyl-CoA synthase [Chelativorans sp. AA-79]WEX11168.1 malonyl-CoA synthase [Chelativorans sp. AA-79]
MADSLFSHLITQGSDPDRTALIVPGGGVVSYRDLDRMSARYAHALCALGVSRGDRVAVQAEKSLDVVLLYLGAIRMGAVYLPLNTAYTAAETSYFLADAAPAVFVCDPSMENTARELCRAGDTKVATLGGDLGALVDAQPDQFETAAVSERDLAAILYTSGTTGRSKGAMLTHGNLLSNVQALRECWRYTPEDVLIHALPIFHTHGLFVALNLTFFSKASAILLPKFDPDAIMNALPSATVLMGVPTFYTRLLARPELSVAACRHMRVFISGSAPLRAETHEEWQRRTGHAILERYGMTETNMNTSNPYDGERRPGTVGFPLPGVSLRIVDAQTNVPAGADEVGMIQVKGPNVFRGYWRMPEKTAAEFTSDGYFITGDLGKVDGDGYVHIIGRQKDLVITGGYNVYPKEIETEIDAIPGVAESAVFGIEDADMGERVIAAVITDGSRTLQAADIEDHLAGRLARYKRPSEIVFLSELPRNTMGKVQKEVLRRNHAETREPLAAGNER